MTNPPDFLTGLLEDGISSLMAKTTSLSDNFVYLELNKLVSEITPSHYRLLEKIELFEVLPSTNDYLLGMLPQRVPKPQAVFAESQSAGKGRLGRQWYSPLAQNIYFSLLWYFPNAYLLSGLSLATAVAIARVLQRYGIEKGIGVKWPNDVLWQNRKLAGTLIEVSCQSTVPCCAVIGIGLNVNMSQQNSYTISQPWSSVSQIIGSTADRNKLAGVLLDELIKTLLLFQDAGIAPFIETWNALDITRDQMVTVHTPLATFTGKGQGINLQGHFLLQVAKEIKVFSGGEVSLRCAGLSL
jgi:BirA family biotin operon repressor/biotin-[acetyl-CoA-carboxylase] ligase